MNKKITGIFKDELGGKIMKEFCGPRDKTYANLINDDSEKKQAKETTKCIIKRRIRFKDYPYSLFNNNIILRSQLRFKSNLHIMYTEKVNKIAISSNDDKRLQAFDKVTTYPYVTDLFIRGRKINISIVFITQSYFKVPKDVRNNTTHFCIEKIPNKREIQQIAINHSSDINTKDFVNIYRKYTAEPYSFLVNDTMLSSNNPLRVRKNLFGIECNSIV